MRTFPTARRIGNGWQWMTSVLPVGDVDGNGYQDLIARGSDGLMRFYSFRSDGTLAGGRVVGNGWQGFTHAVSYTHPDVYQRQRRLLPVGDVDGNGRQDLIAGSTDGYMRFYSFRADGLLEGGRIVGNGWNVFTHVVAIRSEPALATPTRLYGITRSGDMLSYTVTATGNMYLSLIHI